MLMLNFYVFVYMLVCVSEISSYVYLTMRLFFLYLCVLITQLILSLRFVTQFGL